MPWLLNLSDKDGEIASLRYWKGGTEMSFGLPLVMRKVALRHRAVDPPVAVNQALDSTGL